MSENLSYIFVYYSIYMSAAIFLITLKNLVIRRWNVIDELLVVLSIIVTSGLLTLLYQFNPTLLFANLFFNILLLFIVKNKFRNYSYAGINFYIANYLMVFAGLMWGVHFIWSIHISWLTRLLLVITTPLLFITLPSDIVQLVEQYDVLCREKWMRPRLPFPPRTKKHAPMVSLHVPIHSEPPHIVIETLDVLSKLDYKNFEVIVVDNNTSNPTLWQPVREHCEKLGNKFRFFHIMNVKGAKAGALNFALKQTNPRASLVGVIDADYHADSSFVKALVGYFDDPKVGFVQTPHDYREWEKNLYLTMCYWEYKIFFHTTLVSLNERDAALTVGTMCLIRKKTLKEAGGWAKWCVTEDSELAIRIHDKGYSSVYVDKTYGRGLIPETFSGYKKQRYRWTAGPVQEFQFHWKHLSGFSRNVSSLSFIQRILHLNHGLDNVIVGFTIPLTVFSLAVIFSLILHHEVVHVPFELWLAATVMLFSSKLLNWLMYKATINPTFKEILGEIFASKALSHTVTYSAFRTLFTGDAKWHRTNKFKETGSLKGALLASKEEGIIGLLILAFIVVCYKAFPYPGLSLMFLIGMFYSCLGYFAAVGMSLIGFYSMKKEEKSNDFAIPYLSLAPSLAIQ